MGAWYFGSSHSAGHSGFFSCLGCNKSSPVETRLAWQVLVEMDKWSVLLHRFSISSFFHWTIRSPWFQMFEENTRPGKMQILCLAGPPWSLLDGREKETTQFTRWWSLCSLRPRIWVNLTLVAQLFICKTDLVPCLAEASVAFAYPKWSVFWPCYLVDFLSQETNQSRSQGFWYLGHSHLVDDLEWAQQEDVWFPSQNRPRALDLHPGWSCCLGHCRV